MLQAQEIMAEAAKQEQEEAEQHASQLEQQAQQALAQVHTKTVAAQRMLEVRAESACGRVCVWVGGMERRARHAMCAVSRVCCWHACSDAEDM